MIRHLHRRYFFIPLAVILAVFLYVYPDVRSQTIDASISIGSMNANPGDTITLPILISTTTSIRGYQFDVTFDSSRLQVTNGSPQSVYDSGWMKSNAGGNTTLLEAHSPGIDNVNGTITQAAWILVNGNGLGAQGSGTLTFISFTIPANAPNGTALVTLSNVILADLNANNINNIQIASGWVQIGGGTPQVPKGTNLTVQQVAQQGTIFQSLKVIPLDWQNGNGPIPPDDTHISNGSYPLGFYLYLTSTNNP